LNCSPFSLLNQKLNFLKSFPLVGLIQAPSPRYTLIVLYHCKSAKYDISRFEDLGRMKDEEQREELRSQVPRHLIWKQTPKKTKNTSVFNTGLHSHVPGAQNGAPGAWNTTHMCLAHGSMCMFLADQGGVLWLFGAKSPVF